MAPPRLTRVTRVSLTGADDYTDPRDLVALSEEFPFVEWGILFSTGRMGTVRYPTMEWIDSLEPHARKLKLAAHFCEQYTRDTMGGDDKWLVGKEKLFQRIQLNGFSPSDGDVAVQLSRKFDFEFILQAKNEIDLAPIAAIAFAMGKGRASVLYDPSGGQGLVSRHWPDDIKGVRLGFAGGIDPDNVKAVLHEIGMRSPSYWIDMESGVRTDGIFDLAKCQKVLEAWAQWDGGGRYMSM